MKNFLENYSVPKPTEKIVTTCLHSVLQKTDFEVVSSIDQLVASSKKPLGQIYARLQGLVNISSRRSQLANTYGIKLGAGIALQVTQEYLGEQRMSKVRITQENLNDAEEDGFRLLLPPELQPDDHMVTQVAPVIKPGEIAGEFIGIEKIIALANPGPQTQEESIRLLDIGIARIDPLVSQVVRQYIEVKQLSTGHKADVLLGAFEVVNILAHNKKFQSLRRGK